MTGKLFPSKDVVEFRLNFINQMLETLDDELLILQKRRDSLSVEKKIFEDVLNYINTSSGVANDK